MHLFGIKSLSLTSDSNTALTMHCIISKTFERKSMTHLLFLAFSLALMFGGQPNASCNVSPACQVTIDANNQNQGKINCLMHYHSNGDEVVDKVAKILKFDLTFSDQLALRIEKKKKEITKKEQSTLLEKDVPLFLQLKKQKQSILVRLLNTYSGETIYQKSFPLDGSATKIAHTISNELMPKLTNEKGIAHSTLSYCKQFSNKQPDGKIKIMKAVCIADYACSVEKIIDPGKTLNVAPSWHSKAPVLFYSKFTKSNGQLVSFDLKSKKQQVICSYDGLNMQPSFSNDGNRAALCMTSQKGNSEIYLYDHKLCEKVGKRVFRQLTANGGSNSSPCLLPNDDLIFCSDFQTGGPQLYYLNHKTHKTTRLSNGRSYCAAPSYHHKKHALVYTRFIKGVFQLFSMQFTKNKVLEKQLTFDKGDKVDPAWSPCGNYIAFVYDKLNSAGKKIPQIASFNMRSKTIKTLTHDQHPKSFPRWTKGAYYQL